MVKKLAAPAAAVAVAAMVFLALFFVVSHGDNKPTAR
jgi:negative regulator of sigma E activity